MIPKRIAVKNFLTFGELPGGKPVELTFPDGDDRLWVLCGANGTGKSAVFDAITYALFGEHRGGKQKAEQLIRHDSNGFEVEVDFEFNGVDYQVRRTKPRAGATTQHVKVRVEGEWQPVRVNDNKGAVTARDIERWVTDTLGLDHDSFTNSVLLQQGKADKLFTAGREERLNVLKGIIGFEQYESLSGRINAAAKKAAAKAEQVLEQRNAIEPVADEAIEQATRTLSVVEVAAVEAREVSKTAAERVGRAMLWEKLNQERGELVARLAEADRLRADGNAIRAKKKLLDELTAAVPLLQALVGLRAQIERLSTELTQATDLVDAKTAAREAERTAANTERAKAHQHQTEADKLAAIAKELVGHISLWKNYVAEAEAIAGMDLRLSRDYPPDLDGQLEAAVASEAQAAKDEKTTAAAKTRADTLLSQAKEQQKRFANVKVGVDCPHCRQPVNEAHADKIRKDLAAEVKRLQTDFDDSSADAANAGKALAAARDKLAKHKQQKTDRDTLRTKREAKSESLKAHGAVGDAAALRTQLTDKEKQKLETDCKQAEEARHHREASREAARRDTAWKKLEGEVLEAEAAARRHDSALTTALAQERTTLAQLPTEWLVRLPGLDSEQVTRLAGESDSLVAAGIAEQSKKLENDENLRAVWECRLSAVDADIGKIPEADRVSEAIARQQHTEAEAAAAATADTSNKAATILTELTNRKERLQQLTKEHREAAEEHRLLARLDKLLGEGGLQRELVREAEEAVIAFANDTLRELSGGDLALEEDTSQDSTRTFDLRARRAGGEPIGVAFLSGSQRFRVAVSIALAVGRFAGGRARPLESVIIDEGFGSLDPEGLEAMAKELKRLQEAKSLKRVILVSHQPEFTARFPVGYTLTPGETGTTATPFRR